MTTVLLHPEPGPPVLLSALDMRGATWKAVADQTEAAEIEPDDGWDAAVIAVDVDADRSFALARWLHERGDGPVPTLLLTSAERLGELGARIHLFEDFCLTPFHPTELEARVEHLLGRLDDGSDANIISYGPLSLNVETYQAVIDGRALDLTYMEYELLRYLAAEPGKVFSREILLSEVWGYDYYGGARTVDVHIRRLRAKLGEEHANMISTVRSVGYRLGQARWSDQ